MRIFALLALGAIMDKMAYAAADDVAVGDEVVDVPSEVPVAEDNTNTEVDGVGCYYTSSYYYNSYTYTAELCYGS